LPCRKAIINFHDPYPLFFDTSGKRSYRKKDLIDDLKHMFTVVQNAAVQRPRICYPSLQLIYGNQKKFYTLPHQYDQDVLNLSSSSFVRKNKNRFHSIMEVTICRNRYFD
jgi:hypothetical protein